MLAYCSFQHENKKVLLREHKRHTDRGASSTPSVSRSGVLPLPRVPPWPGLAGEVPEPGLMGGGVPEVGYPLARSDSGCPQQGTPSQV